MEGTLLACTKNSGSFRALGSGSEAERVCTTPYIVPFTKFGVSFSHCYIGPPLKAERVLRFMYLARVPHDLVGWDEWGRAVGENGAGLSAEDLFAE